MAQIPQCNQQSEMPVKIKTVNKLIVRIANIPNLIKRSTFIYYALLCYIFNVSRTYTSSHWKN